MITTEKIDIESLVQVELPPLSNAAMRVSTLVQDMNSSTHAIAEAIGFDPGLTTRILRAANSPLFALERSVTSLPAAVITLGNKTIHALAIVSTVSDAFGRDIGQTPAGRELWGHLVATGLAARELSLTLGLRSSDEAFLCGLLHDIGKLLMMRHDEKLFMQVNEIRHEAQSLESEKELFGYTHAQLGALMTKRWGLPEEIGFAIYSHHQPSEANQHVYMARLVDVGNQLAHAATEGDLEAHEEMLSSAESVIALKFTWPQLQEAWARAASKMGEMMSCLK